MRRASSAAKLRTRGRAGHASIPGMGDNALLKLAPILGRFAEQPELEPTPAGIAFLGALVGEDLDGAGSQEIGAAMEKLRAASPLWPPTWRSPCCG